ncbi:MAG TPA: response regulator [Pyrinomonadaceae bacterium]|nr:response regulator [Pyrinomonadaceae bacterium]
MPPTLLIADDYDDTRELLCLILQTEGYTVRQARDGREFLEAARNETPDLALIDLSMPTVDGWDALRELRADERTRSIPCIAVTAFAADLDRQRALDAGFDAYLSKPFRAKELIELVGRLLGTRADGESDRDGDGDGRRASL